MEPSGPGKIARSPVGMLVLLPGLSWSSWWRACAWLELFYLRLAGCPSPTRLSYSNRAPFSRSWLLDSPTVGTDSTFTLPLLGGFQFLQPTLCPGSFFWSLLISPSRSHPLKLEEAHFFNKTNKSCIVLWIFFFFFRFLSSKLFAPFGIQLCVLLKAA